MSAAKPSGKRNAAPDSGAALFLRLHSVGEPLADINADAGSDRTQHERRHDPDGLPDGPANATADRRADETEDFFQLATAFF
jgi:hypothetical protein